MVQVNLFRREVNCKIVYYGPGLSGKTTNLEMVHARTPVANRGEMTSIATEHDRTLFFDFMPIDLGTVGGMKTKLRLFTVPGQVFYNATRKLVLQGTDGIIFVADSQRSKLQENIESLRNLEENLKIHKLDIRTIPLVIQWNKRDTPTAMPVADLEREINYLHVPTFEAIAVTAAGVFPTLKKCAALVLDSLPKHGEDSRPSEPIADEATRPDGIPRPISVSTGSIGSVKRITSTIVKPPMPGSQDMGQVPVFKKLQKVVTDQEA